MNIQRLMCICFLLCCGLSFGQINRKTKVKYGLELTYSPLPTPNLKQVEGTMFLPVKPGLGTSFGVIGLKKINSQSSFQFGLNSSFHFDYRVGGGNIHDSQNNELIIGKSYHFTEFNGVKINLPLAYLLNITCSRNKALKLDGKLGLSSSINFSNSSGDTFYGFGSGLNNSSYEVISFFFHYYETEQLFEFYPSCGLQLMYKTKFLVNVDVNYNHYTRVNHYTILRTINNETIDESTVSFETRPYYFSLRLSYLF
ncbi:MAG: hypothetical protein ACPGVE_04290 [Flavobacteriales bacterium]